MSRPASPIAATGALAAHELRLTARRGENVLVTIVIPPAVLLFFATAGIVPGIAGRPVDFLLPGALALGVIATGLVNLGIATAYERSYGVFERAFALPSSVDVDQIEARYDNGMLTVTLPKAERARPRQIEVKTS